MESNPNFLGNIYGYTGRNFAGAVWDADSIAPTINTMQGGGREPHIMDIRAIDEQNNTVREETFGTIMTDGSSPKHNNRVLEIEMGGSCHIRQATKEGVIECMLPGIADLEYPNSTTRRGRTQEKGQICPTITTENIPNVLEEWTWEVDGVKYLIRIRKLTPRECGRLMGVSDHDIDKILDVNSNTQAYKQFGNSIVVDVMENIFREMIPDFPMNPPIGD